MRGHLRFLSLTCGLILLLCTIGATACGATESHRERVEQLFTTVRSVPEEFVRQIAIARLDLATAASREAWSAEQQAAAEAWLEKVTEAHQKVEAPPPANPRIPAGMLPQRNWIVPHQLEAPADRWGDEVSFRLYCLQNRYIQARADLIAEVANFAEEIWKTARQPADLKPALEPLTALQSEVLAHAPEARRFPNLAWYPGMSTSQGQLMTDCARARLFVAFLLPSEPLIFPAPETDVSAYIRTRVIWNELNSRNEQVFRSFSYHSEVEELDQRLRRLIFNAQRELDRLILRHAPIDEITAAAKRLETFRVPFSSREFLPAPPPKATPPGAFPMGFPFAPGNIPKDYHEMLAQRGPLSPSQIKPIPSVYVHDLEIYRALVALLAAEAAANPPDLTPLRQELRKQMENGRHLPADLRGFINNQTGSESAEAGESPVENFNLPTPKSDAPANIAFKALLTTLETQEINSEAADDARVLLQSWPEDSRSGADLENQAVNNAPFWKSLAGFPNSMAFFAAREKAARQMIQRVSGSLGSGPLAVEIRKKLDTAVSASDWIHANQILAVDGLFSFLEMEEHAEWQRTLRTFAASESAAAQKQIDSAVAGYREILATTRSVAIAKLCAHRLAALRAQKSPRQ